MSIATELQDLNDNILDAYTAVQGKGGTVPANKNMVNLPTAINSISGGGSSQYDIHRAVTGVNQDTLSVPGGLPSSAISVSIPSDIKIIDSYAFASAYRDTYINSISAPTVETVESYGFNGAFPAGGASSATTINFSSLVTARSYSFTDAFVFRAIANVSFPSLETVGAYAFQGAFTSNNTLDGYVVSFPSLTTVSSNAFTRAFSQSAGTSPRKGPKTIDFSGLVTVPSNASSVFSGAFSYSSTVTSVDFSSLETIYGSSCFSTAFERSTLPAIDFPSLTVAGENAFYRAFNYCQSLTTIDFSELTTVEKGAFNQAFTGCGVLSSVDFSNLTTVHSASSYATFGSAFSGNIPITTLDLRKVTAAEPHAFNQICKDNTNVTSARFDSMQSATGLSFNRAFYGCTALTSVNFDGLETVSTSNSDSVFVQAFYGCTSLTSFSFPALETISQGGSSTGLFSEVFRNCTSLTTVSFPELVTLTNTGSAGGAGAGIFYLAFAGCTSLASISFPKLDASTFGSGKQNYFYNMLSGVTGCTLHFPASAQTEVEAMAGYPNFGGTNTTVSFDL